MGYITEKYINRSKYLLAKYDASKDKGRVTGPIPVKSSDR